MLGSMHRLIAALARVALALLVLSLATSTTCTTSGPTGSPEEIAAGRAAVNAELQHYSELVVAMDHAGIAALFAPQGEIVNPGARPVRGPDAIAKYLRGFSRYRVVDDRLAPARTVVHGDTARQVGFYEQHVRTPKGDTLHATGRFEATWLRVRPREWRILRMETLPDRN